MKTVGRENPNRWATLFSNRAPGAGSQNRSCSITWAAKRGNGQPLERCFFLTSTFIERFSKFPIPHAVVRNQLGYVRMCCLIVGQRATVREHLCNYCATRISTVYHTAVRRLRAPDPQTLGDYFRVADIHSQLRNRDN